MQIIYEYAESNEIMMYAKGLINWQIYKKHDCTF